MIDLNAITQLEEILQIKINKAQSEVDEDQSWSKLEYTYTINSGGQIVGLNLDNCNANDLKLISPAIKSLANLKELNLGSNEISDISPLSQLTNLTSLDLDSNEISDISPLSQLTNLTSLDLSSNKIS